MTRDDPAIGREDLIEALVFWWRYEKSWSPVEGYPTECPSTMGYRTSRQYDDGNGAMETDSRGRWAQQIGAAVDRRRLQREVQHLQGRLAEARTARLDLLVYLDRASSSAAVLRRERDAVVETAAGVAKLAGLDELPH